MTSLGMNVNRVTSGALNRLRAPINAVGFSSSARVADMALCKRQQAKKQKRRLVEIRRLVRSSTGLRAEVGGMLRVCRAVHALTRRSVKLSSAAWGRVVRAREGGKFTPDERLVAR